MLNNRFLYRTARPSRGGFTLVELLVVIGIIAILAGVALGPITNGIKKAKQSAGLQTVRTIATSEFTFSNDNNGAYPDTSMPSGNTGSAAEAVARALLAGNYVTDPTIFWISGGVAGKYTGTAASTAIAASNISWDFAGYGGSGISSNAPDQLPVVWSSVAGTGGVEPTIATAGALNATPGSVDPYGTQGVAVAYKSNSAKFIIATGSPTPVSALWDLTYPGYTGATVLKGGG
jgi:prepilin-type N-terminal cleavage/methylation domain-containing protein